MSRPFQYNKESVEEYLKVNAEHQTIKELAKALGIHYATVFQKLKAMGLKTLKDNGNRETRIDYNRICEYVRINWEYETALEMSRFLKVSTPSIYKAFEMVGLTPLKTGEIDNCVKKTHQKSINNQGRAVYFRDQTIIDYVKTNIDEKTKSEIAQDLNVSFVTVERICAIYNIKPSPAKEGDIHYFPPFEQLDNKGHDALLNVLTAAFWHDGRAKNQGCPD
jgi:hypothetical protein